MNANSGSGGAAFDTSPVDQAGLTASQPHSPKRLRSQVWLYSFLIAAVFALWGFHTVGCRNVVDTDGARHAMNGAFIHDLILRGNYADLVHPENVLHFAKRYYGHLPAISLPYHPPLFPAFEAIFYLVLGVNVFAARLAIAFAVGLSAMCLFRLVMATHGSLFVAAFASITFLSLPYAVWLSSDVMLEFPTLVFIVLAMYCLAGVDTEYSLRRAVLFAVLAGAAVWTKQQAVFLGAVPFLYIALIGRWRLFLKPAVWVSAGLFLVLVAALTALSLPVHGAGVNQALPPEGHNHVFVRNLMYYMRNYPSVVGPAGMILLVAFLAALAGRLVERRSTALYVAWAASSLAVLLFLGPFSLRYLFFLLPPMMVLGYAALSAIGDRLPRWRRPVLVTSSLALTAMVVIASQGKVAYMHGPDEAARVLAALRPHRILYCGGTDGSFIFSYRSYRPPMEAVIVAGDKLPPAVFTTAGVDDFARRYGIEYIVLEHAPDLRPRFKHPWEALMGAPPSSFQPLRDVPLSSSDSRWNGFLRIYRFTNPGPTPDDALTMRMNMVGGSMRFSIGH